MINYHSDLVTILSAILPTYYELTINSECKVPCISYQERDNYEQYVGDTLGYSEVSYQIKVWANSISQIQQYAALIDSALKPLGWTRTSSGELFDKNSTMIQKIMVYEATFNETYTVSTEN